MQLQVPPYDTISEEERIARESSPYKPRTVFYLHMKDDRGFINNWNKCSDYVCCVMARTVGEAIEKTQKIALSRHGSIDIKIMGMGHAKEEWVDEENPITTDENYYEKQTTALFNRLKTNKHE